MSRPIPTIRAEMLQLAEEMRQDGFTDWADRLVNMAAATRRRPMAGKAERKSVPLTARLAAQIRAYIYANPCRSQQEVANRFKVNPGRVSEAIHFDT